MAANGTSEYFTVAGTKRLFSTRSLRLPETVEAAAVNGAEANGVPSVASQRALLRARLPAIYQEGDFGLRFVGGFENVLDAVVALLDSLHSHFRADLAPQDVLELLGAWLGIELDESWPDERRRELVRRAGELAKRRGTKAGLELALSIAFPDFPLRVEDGGQVVWSTDPDKLPETKSGFVVYCDAPLEEKDMAAVARMVEEIKPVHVRYRLRVKAPRKAQ